MIIFQNGLKEDGQNDVMLLWDEVLREIISRRLVIPLRKNWHCSKHGVLSNPWGIRYAGFPRTNHAMAMNLEIFWEGAREVWPPLSGTWIWKNKVWVFWPENTSLAVNHVSVWSTGLVSGQRVPQPLKFQYREELGSQVTAFFWSTLGVSDRNVD